MATTLNLKKVLNRPQWEMMNPLPAANTNGSFVRSMTIPAYAIDYSIFAINATSSIWQYSAKGDAEINLATSGVVGTFGSGCCGKIVPTGSSGTASAGGTTTLTTTQTIVRDLRGYKIRITGGPGAGDERVIASNTIGANSVITVTSAFSATITSSSTYTLIYVRFFIFNPSATAPGLSMYDWALNTWVTKSVTNLPTNFNADALLVGTPSIVGDFTDSSDSRVFSAASSSTLTIATAAWSVNQWTNGYIITTGGTGAGQVRTIASNTSTVLTIDSTFSVTPDVTTTYLLVKGFDGSRSYTFSSAASTTLVTTNAAWTVNQWSNSQVRIVGGTGAGQVRTISSNTATTLTISASWTTTPDSTSIWVIEGNDDTLYLLGAATVTLYKYTISGNTWSTLTPGTARAAVTGNGLSASWIYGVTDSAWTAVTAIQNGRFIYSFRGGNVATLDKYDIALNTWTNGISYGNSAELLTTGSCYEYNGLNYIYVAQAIGRILYFDLIKSSLEPACEIAYAQGTATTGDKLFLYPYTDGTTRLDILYHWRNTGVELLRAIVWFI